MTAVQHKAWLIEMSHKQTVSDDRGSEMPACIIKQSQQGGRKSSRGRNQSRAQWGLAKVFTAAPVVSQQSQQ